jgi:hypothetical protein
MPDSDILWGVPVKEYSMLQLPAPSNTYWYWLYAWFDTMWMISKQKEANSYEWVIVNIHPCHHSLTQ